MQTIGERLEEARKKKGISIREAAEATKIRGDYLQKFESNQFDIGLTEIYTRGFLRTYSNFLKLPADRILNDYAALGRGDVRPRQPSREVYGRMDISVASTPEASERATTTAEPGANDSTSSRSAAPARSRAATSLPTGPDPAVVFRYVKWGGIALIVIVALLILKSLFFDRPAAPASSSTTSMASPSAPGTTPSVAPAATERSITLIAHDVVWVKVNRRNGDVEGEELFKATLARGQQQVVPFPGPIFISFSAGENLEIDYKGKRYPTGMTGANRVKME